jgi:hypothetical protein
MMRYTAKNWKGILPAKHVIQILRDSVVPYYKELYQTYCKKYSGTSAVYHKTKTKSGVEVSSDLMKNF